MSLVPLGLYVRLQPHGRECGGGGDCHRVVASCACCVHVLHTTPPQHRTQPMVYAAQFCDTDVLEYLNSVDGDSVCLPTEVSCATPCARVACLSYSCYSVLTLPPPHTHTHAHTHTQQQGELALHAACAAKRPTSVLNLLLEWFPEGASVPNNVSVVPSPGCLALAGVGVYQRRGEGGGEK